MPRDSLVLDPSRKNIAELLPQDVNRDFCWVPSFTDGSITTSRGGGTDTCPCQQLRESAGELQGNGPCLLVFHSTRVQDGRLELDGVEVELGESPLGCRRLLVSSVQGFRLLKRGEPGQLSLLIVEGLLQVLKALLVLGDITLELCQLGAPLLEGILGPL